MKLLVLNLFLLLSVILFTCSEPEQISEQTKPNILFIFPDQFRPHALGFMNEDPVKTPNLDKFASQSRVFVNAVSNRPLCSPYRAMLMTGQYPFTNGVLTNCNTSSRKYSNYLDEDANTVSDVLSENGYNCGYIGKWHLDAPLGPDVDDWRESVWDAYTPPDKRHGFEFWYAYGTYDQHLQPHYWVNDASRNDTTIVDQWSPEHEADIAIDFISDQKEDQPWCLFVSMNPPHPPYHLVPDKYKKIYQDYSAEELLNRPNVPKDYKAAFNNVKGYFAMVNGVDEQIGRILAYLEERGLVDNTIVVFTADHGELMGSHGRMQKVWWYEESFRIPFMIRWPDKIKEGVDSLHLAVPDVMPTLLSLSGLKEKIPQEVQGKDYADLMLGKKINDLPEFNLYLNPRFESALGGSRGLRTDRYTFVVERNKQGVVEKYYLYDNLIDLYQMKNIAGENDDLVRSFENKLMKKLEEIEDHWIIYDDNLK